MKAVICAVRRLYSVGTGIVAPHGEIAAQPQRDITCGKIAPAQCEIIIALPRFSVGTKRPDFFLAEIRDFFSRKIVIFPAIWYNRKRSILPAFLLSEKPVQNRRSNLQPKAEFPGRFNAAESGITGTPDSRHKSNNDRNQTTAIKNTIPQACGERLRGKSQ